MSAPEGTIITSEYYILKGHDAVQVDSMTWAAWFEVSEDRRRVAWDRIGGATVSTIFLGLDHSFGSGPPLLFETFVFGGPLDQEQERCTTWEQAEAMHAAMVERVMDAKEDLGMNTSYCPKCNQIQGFPPGTLANCHHCGYEGCEFLFSYEEDGIQIPYEEDEDV